MHLITFILYFSHALLETSTPELQNCECNGKPALKISQCVLL